jgi:hypothetical protein
VDSADAGASGSGDVDGTATEFGYESFELSTDPGLVMLVFTVEPGSPSSEALQLLASWAAPPRREDEAAEIGAEQERRT